MPGTTNIPLAYDHRNGPAGRPTLVLIQGLGMHMQDWPPNFLEACAAHFNLLLIDNRDCGRSAQTGPLFEENAELKAISLFGAEPVPAPYDLFDMASDVLALMDGLQVKEVHVAGFSMGGMIAQIIAALHPQRVLSLTSLMSSGGQPWIDCSEEGKGALVRAMKGFTDRPAAVADAITGMRIFGAKARKLSDDVLAASAMASFGYAYSPGGMLRQALAMRSSGDRSALLSTIATPTLIVHGAQDTCIHADQARALAAVVPGARFRLFQEAGHDLADLESSDIDKVIEDILRS